MLGLEGMRIGKNVSHVPLVIHIYAMHIKMHLMWFRRRKL